jgi:hypothetical protein
MSHVELIVEVLGGLSEASLYLLMERESSFDNKWDLVNDGGWEFGEMLLEIGTVDGREG